MSSSKSRHSEGDFWVPCSHGGGADLAAGQNPERGVSTTWKKSVRVPGILSAVGQD